MLSGRKAFWGEALETVVYRIMSEPVPPLHDQPPAINAAIQMAVQKDPGQRYVSAAQMKAALSGGMSVSNTGFARQAQTGWQAADQTVMASPSMSNHASQLAVDRTRMAPQTAFTPPNSQPVAVQAPMPVQSQTSGMSGNRVFVAVIGVVVVLIGLGIGAIMLRSATSRAGAGIAADERSAISTIPIGSNITTQETAPSVPVIRELSPPPIGSTAQIQEPNRGFQPRNNWESTSPPPPQESSFQYSEPNEQLAQQRFQEGLAAYNQGLYREATRFFEEADKFSPGGFNSIKTQAREYIFKSRPDYRGQR
jgi:hypothetical protein